MFQHKSLAEKKARKLNGMLFCHQIAIYRRIRFLPRKSTNAANTQDIIRNPLKGHNKDITLHYYKSYYFFHITVGISKYLCLNNRKNVHSSIHMVFHHFWTEWMKYFQAKCKWLTFFLFPANLRGILNWLMWTNQRFCSGTV